MTTGEGIPQNDAEAAGDGIAWPPSRGIKPFAALLWVNFMKLVESSKRIPMDYVQAYAWYNIAAAQGDETAKENLEIITKKMTTAGITKAQELSREYWEAYGPNRASSE